LRFPALTLLLFPVRRVNVKALNRLERARNSTEQVHSLDTCNVCCCAQIVITSRTFHRTHYIINLTKFKTGSSNVEVDCRGEEGSRIVEWQKRSEFSFWTQMQLMRIILLLSPNQTFIRHVSTICFGGVFSNKVSKFQPKLWAELRGRLLLFANYRGDNVSASAKFPKKGLRTFACLFLPRKIKRIF